MEHPDVIDRTLLEDEVTANYHVDSLLIEIESISGAQPLVELLAEHFAYDPSPCARQRCLLHQEMRRLEPASPPFINNKPSSCSYP